MTFTESFGRGYPLARYGRRALAEDAGAAPDGTGSPRIAIGGDAGGRTDPDGFAGEPAPR
ncbi:hypothetical protein [Goodfellowiella coeruleoviolacea]|uniref:Uncharacterized protein n=1 Tax=Goodfellowiella coeruleoviolacea TaxID=334858 RepID=A0AAE3GG10_9PSEU|nr:hypothetical protein [Goodfellowiella coeruleoviolacea]